MVSSPLYSTADLLRKRSWLRFIGWVLITAAQVAGLSAVGGPTWARIAAALAWLILAPIGGLCLEDAGIYGYLLEQHHRGKG